MGIEQPYEDQPDSEADYLVNDTVVLEDERGENAYSHREIDTSDNPRLRGRAIARGGGNIQFTLMEANEFEYYENGENFWFETRSQTDKSINFEERIGTGGAHVLVVEAEQDEGRDGIEITVQVWEF